MEYYSHPYVNKIEPPEPFWVPSTSQNRGDLKGGSSELFQIELPGRYVVSIEPGSNRATVDIFKVFGLDARGLYMEDSLETIGNGSYVMLESGIYRLKNPSNFPSAEALIRFEFVTM